MPELPDVEVYREQLERRVRGRRLIGIRLASPFLLRSFEVPLAAAANHTVVLVRRLGKRLVFALEGDLFLVIHLMISGRLHWKEAGAPVPGKVGLAAFDFDDGTLILTEASRKRRAALHLVSGENGLRELDAGGLEPLTATLSEFRSALDRENHTLKRSLTDPRLFSGIGNAYSDEILWEARLSPVQLTGNLTAEAAERLYLATRSSLRLWLDRLRLETGDEFPEKVTAFRPEMAVHGRFKLPCPRCGSPVQRIRRADNEVNYCATCQTGGKLLADRALSRLLGKDWPKTLEEMEEWKRELRSGL